MNIPLFKVFMSEDAVSMASEVLRSGYIGQGSVVDQFEESLQTFLRNDYIASVNSATSAETLAYHLLKQPAELCFKSHFESNPRRITWGGLQPGDEVLATPLTCTATNWPILANGLSLKWVDISPSTLGLDLEDLRRKLSHRTKLISIVHWGGYPIDLQEIFEIQKECFSLFGHWPLVIEDCAHAFGSTFDGTPLGSHGNIATFSFQAIKHITSVDGGALVVSDQTLYARSKLLRWYGIDRESNRKDFRCEADIPEWGFKFHMNDVSAAIGLKNLEHYDFISQGFKRCADYYRKHLSDIPSLKLTQPPSDNRETNPWLFSILVERKSDFYRKMHSNGVAVSQVHERNDKHSCVVEYRSLLPALDYICDRLICIPCGWWVSDDDLDYIVNLIKEGW